MHRPSTVEHRMTELPEVVPRHRRRRAAPGCWSRSRWPGAVVLLLPGAARTGGATCSACATVVAAFVVGLLIFFDTLALGPRPAHAASCRCTTGSPSAA